MRRIAGARTTNLIDRRVRATLAALAAVVLLLAGCGSNGSEPSATTSTPPPKSFQVRYSPLGPFTVLVGSTRAPGSVLTDGLAVPPGSDILGTTFPDIDGKGGFLALGLVPGDPLGVFNDYVERAQGMGMNLNNGGGCIPSPTALVCARTLTDDSDGESLSIRVERRPASPGYLSHVALRYQPPGSVDTTGLSAPGAAPPTAPISPVTLPSTVAVPSDQGWNLSVAPKGPGLKLVAGSVLVGAPGPCGCGPQGWSAVLRITGDLDTVLAGYGQQLTNTPLVPKIRKAGARTVLMADLGVTSAGFTQFRVVAERGVTYLMIATAQP